jgi:hypothetical protein
MTWFWRLWTYSTLWCWHLTSTIHILIELARRPLKPCEFKCLVRRSPRTSCPWQYCLWKFWLVSKINSCLFLGSCWDLYNFIVSQTCATSRPSIWSRLTFCLVILAQDTYGLTWNKVIVQQISLFIFSHVEIGWQTQECSLIANNSSWCDFFLFFELWVQLLK